MAAQSAVWLGDCSCGQCDCKESYSYSYPDLEVCDSIDQWHGGVFEMMLRRIPGSSQMVPGCWARGGHWRTNCKLLQISRTSGDPHLSSACNHILSRSEERGMRNHTICRRLSYIRSGTPRTCDDGCTGAGPQITSTARQEREAECVVAAQR